MNIRLFLKHLSAVVIPDNLYISWVYKKKMGTPMHWDNPQTFTEKIQWLKLHWRHQILTQCADKFTVRDFVKERIGEETLKTLYGVYTNVDQIDLNALPKSFILKTTHGSGGHIVCQNKDDLDWEKAKAKLKAQFYKNQYFFCREWCYKQIYPRILCEEFLFDEGYSFYDINFFCFHGTPRFVEICADNQRAPRIGMYDLDLNPLERRYSKPRLEEPVERPLHFEKMVEYAAALSQGFPFVRVDFNYLNGRICFGEMTFYPLSGVVKFNPESFNQFLGSFLELPRQNPQNLLKRSKKTRRTVRFL